MIRPTLLALAGLCLLTTSLGAAEDRRARVLADRDELLSNTNWIYNDLAKGFAAAAATRKPMLVVFRCVP